MNALKRILGHGSRLVLVTLSAATLTTFFFMVLPLIQAITSAKDDLYRIHSVDSVALPPPPPPPEPEPEEEEEEPEDEPPELEEEIQPLDLSQLELAFGDGFGGGGMYADLSMKMSAIGGGGDSDVSFALDELDQRPRPISQPMPQRSASLRKRQGSVVVIFIVNERGRVEQAKVQSSSDSAFEKSAVSAVKKYKFEPGKKGGKAVRSRMRIELKFPKEG